MYVCLGLALYLVSFSDARYEASLWPRFGLILWLMTCHYSGRSKEVSECQTEG